MALTKKERPKVLSCIAEEVTTGCGHLYVRMGFDEAGNLLEIIATLGKSGGCAYCQLEALSRAVSLGLKYGIPIDDYVKQLIKIECPNKYLWPEEERILSCADGIAKVLERHNGHSVP
jgi:ribonucleoside-diphosphate reductase alpha chain